MRDMLRHGLEISIQKREVSFQNLRHPLAMENYFLVHRWQKESIPFILYTEGELRTLHRTFGHPSD